MSREIADSARLDKQICMKCNATLAPRAKVCRKCGSTKLRKKAKDKRS